MAMRSRHRGAESDATRLGGAAILATIPRLTEPGQPCRRVAWLRPSEHDCCLMSPAVIATEWRSALAPYARANVGRSVLNVATSIVPYLALMVAMYLLIDVSPWLVALLTPLAAGFMVRTFIVFHDCAHGSFLPSKRANDWLGTLLSLFVYSNFLAWRHHHAIHHGTAGDLGRRGIGDVQLMTVEEYSASPWRRRLYYRAYRNPLVMFGLGPLVEMVIEPRMVPRPARQGIRRGVYATNAALAVLLGALCLLIGW